MFAQLRFVRRIRGPASSTVRRLTLLPNRDAACADIPVSLFLVILVILVSLVSLVSLVVLVVLVALVV